MSIGSRRLWSCTVIWGWAAPDANRWSRAVSALLLRLALLVTPELREVKQYLLKRGTVQPGIGAMGRPILSWHRRLVGTLGCIVSAASCWPPGRLASVPGCSKPMRGSMCGSMCGSYRRNCGPDGTRDRPTLLPVGECVLQAGILHA